jgi:hypothetical protein
LKSLAFCNARVVGETHAREEKYLYRLDLS